MNKKEALRIAYTKTQIKDGFLKLKQKYIFQEITVSALCREAGVSRSTFYAHYSNTLQVLEEIFEDLYHQCSAAIQAIFLRKADLTKMPFCDFIRKNPKYHGIFLDQNLTGIIIERMVANELAYYHEHLPNEDISDNQLKMMLRFQLSGCLSAIISGIDSSDAEWENTKDMIHQIFKEGLRSIE